MCGRYTLFSTKQEIEETFNATGDEDSFQANYNVGPGSANPVVFMDRPNIRNIRWFKWGLIPQWSDDEQVGNKMINVWADSLLEKPSFKKPFQRQRCIIPANGFYEWQTIYKLKAPFYVRTLDQELFGFAGIYERWESEDHQNVVHSYAIITTEANTLLQPLHDRMPVILERKDYEEWLDPLNSKTDLLQKMLKPYPTERMSIYRVSNDINDTEKNGEQLIQPTDV